MKLRRAHIHNFRSLCDCAIELSDFTLLVGANNAGKSNVLNALRLFYEQIKWTNDDVPKAQTKDDDSWIELTFTLNADEWSALAEKYKKGTIANELRVRRYFRSAQKDRVKSNQSNIYGYVDGVLEEDLFYGAKNVGSAKLGQLVYIPALTTVDEQTKLSGPSPLRDVLNFLLKKIVASSPSYAALVKSFGELNEEAKAKDGFLTELSDPLNTALEGWKIKIDLSVNTLRPEEISKNLISFSFIDSALGDASFDLARYGHGFQRSVIYELIRLAPNFRETKATAKKEFNPDLTIVLFEEPEAFLHPAQQENMAYHLRRLSGEPDQQVLVCTHSSTFVGKAAEKICQIARCRRENGITKIQQVDEKNLKTLFSEGGALLTALQTFVADQSIPDSQKKNAKKLIAKPPHQSIAEDEERFRYQLWLDGERSGLFFADRVLLVEGPSERALFYYLLADEWREYCQHRICVVDVLGKFNFHRYMALMKAFQIPFGVILDDDNNEEHHQAINDLVDMIAGDPNSPILAQPVKIPDCLETMLGLPKLQGNRKDKKPIEIMKAITTSGTITPDRLNSLRNAFRTALALP